MDYNLNLRILAQIFESLFWLLLYPYWYFNLTQGNTHFLFHVIIFSQKYFFSIFLILLFLRNVPIMLDLFHSNLNLEIITMSLQWPQCSSVERYRMINIFCKLWQNWNNLATKKPQEQQTIMPRQSTTSEQCLRKL